MTSINETMGFKRPGKRAFMNLPKNRADAIEVTAAICSSCQRTGARPSRTKGPSWLSCSWCCHMWEFKGNIALQSYDGTGLLVTHDQDLLEEVGTRVWHFEDGRIVDFKGSYEERTSQPATA